MPSLRFSRATIATIAVPHGKASEFFYDTEIPGFGMKASAGGARSWIVQYRSPGERGQKRLTIGKVGVLSLDDARREARVMLAQALTGRDPHAARATTKAQAKVTLESVVDRFLAHVEPRQRPATHYASTLYLKRTWKPLHARPLQAIKRAEIAERLDAIVRESGGVSANRARAALSSLYTYAIGVGLAEVNPVVGTHKPAVEVPRERVLSMAELVAVWRACGDDPFGRIVRLLILTAQRCDEVGAISESELDLDGKLWTLPAARSKNRREHLIPLSDAAVAILAQAPRIEGRVTLFGEGQKGFGGWTKSKERLQKAALVDGKALRPWTLHDIRRSVATHMAEDLNVLPHVVEAVLNHVSGTKRGVAGVYNRASYLREKRAALEAWALHLMATFQHAEP